MGVRGEPIIECKGLWKLFGSREREALSAARDEGLSKQEVLERYDCVVGVAGVSLSVRRGTIFCVMGLSGSGKSTLVRHLNRLIEPTAGAIRILGEDVNSLNDAGLRALRSRHVGMVFQNMALLPHRTVNENVGLALELRGVAKRERDAVVERNLALVELAGWGNRYPEELSGGMKQRVGLARAMAADPEILLMDEPFSALDPLIRRQLQKQFLELSRVVRKTTVFITHDLDEAIRLGDQIAIMKDGRIVQTGTPEDIVTSPADEYVADFVAGISRLSLVTAAKIMEPVNGADQLAWPSTVKARVDDTLNTLVSIACDTDSPIHVFDGDSRVGMISKRTLLKGILG